MNLQSECGKQQQQWKSFSLQRGLAGPGEEGEEVIAMKQQPVAVTVVEQEDPYGRCTNMRLTSFTEGTPAPRDPRLIDLSQSAASTGNLGAGGPPHPASYSPAQFNTLPAQPGAGPGHPAPHPHNTMPAHRTPPVFPHQPTGRHFKPFDHRKINPMAEIRENPYEQQPQLVGNGHGGPLQDNTYIVHHNTHIPHMPSELRHTNYGSKPPLVHPQVLHHRDSVQ